MPATIGVLVLSYNRPTWLREALASVQDADQIVVVDDGSDFDVAEFAPGVLVRNPRISPETRVSTPRMGALFNRGLDAIRTDYVGYVCDDDMLAPGWLKAARDYLDANPETHMVRGDWHVMGTDESAFRGDWVLTTGNFVHRMSCYRDEGCRWNERTLAVQDALFLLEYLRRHAMPHGGHLVPHVGQLAGWRREHERNLIHFTNEYDFVPDAVEVVGGIMEG